MGEEIKRVRAALLPLVEGWGRRQGVVLDDSVVTPVGTGKKALVFLSSDRAIRLFNDPLRLLRYLRVHAILTKDGVPVARLVSFSLTPELVGRRVCGISLEERVTPLHHLAPTTAEMLGSALARLHRLTRGRWGGVFLPGRGSYAELLMAETESRISHWCNQFSVGDLSCTKDWIRSFKSVLYSLEASGYQLVHGDLALANLGVSKGEVLLLDIVRARYGFALEDVVAALDLFRRRGASSRLEEVFWKGYTSQRGLSAVERELMPFFEVAFHAKRLKRAAKHLRKGETHWLDRVLWHSHRLRGVLEKAP